MYVYVMGWIAVVSVVGQFAGGRGFESRQRNNGEWRNL